MFDHQLPDAAVVAAIAEGARTEAAAAARRLSAIAELVARRADGPTEPQPSPPANHPAISTAAIPV
jgi:hypothetical protein